MLIQRLCAVWVTLTACVAIKDLEAQFLPDLCSRDLVIVKVQVGRNTGEKRKMMVSSAYFLHEKDGPPLSKLTAG